MTTISRWGFLAGAALSAVAAAGCTKNQPNRGPDKVTFVTGNGSGGREGFVPIAQAMGFMAARNIVASTLPGAAGDYNLNAVAAGGDFAEIDYSGAVIRAGLGKFDQFRLVAVLNPRIIMTIMSLPGRGIASPADLPGKTIAATSGSIIRTLFPGWARLARLTVAQVQQVKWAAGPGDQLPGMLARGEVDAIGIPVAGMVSVSAVAGVPLEQVVVLPYAYQIGDVYGNVVVTSAALVDRNPSLVKRFVAAACEGLGYMTGHPRESAQLLSRVVPGTAAATAEAEMRLLQPWVGADPTFHQPIVARSIALLRSLGCFDGEVAPEDFIYPGALRRM